MEAEAVSCIVGVAESIVERGVGMVVDGGAVIALVRGDARRIPLADRSVQCVVTSPPYWGLRDYGLGPDTLGLERTPELYVEDMVEVFREVRRVLRDDGTCWINMGDCYAAQMGQRKVTDKVGPKQETNRGSSSTPSRHVPSLKPKDLVGMPWRLAFALQQPYYTGRIKRLEDRIWLAAILDAEGCLFIHKRKAGQHNGQGYYRTNDSYGPSVEISNTSLPLIERVMSIVGNGSICSQGPEENGRRKQRLYRWNLRTVECRDFVRELYPHLVAKQQQARILIGCPSSGERAEAAHAALIALHRRGQSDIDFPAPVSMYEPGWYVRSDIVWSKCNPMPESVRDRPAKSHEFIFLLSKRGRYFYDDVAVRETAVQGERYHGDYDHRPDGLNKRNGREDRENTTTGRNLRSVWTINSQPYPHAHFATFPEALVVPCIKAGTSEVGQCAECGKAWVRVVERRGGNSYAVGKSDTKRRSGLATAFSGYDDGSSAPEFRTLGFRPSCSCVTDRAPVPQLVLDPFGGSGTVALVAAKMGRHAVSIDLKREYLELARERTRGVRAQVPLALDVRGNGRAAEQFPLLAEAQHELEGV